MIRQLDDEVMVSGQVAPHEVAGLADQGVTVLINNRPDGEEPGQPLAAEIEDAAVADAIFTMLMGEQVAPRKEFIKTEARKVRNLDV